jgi:hypothetical protein
MRTLACAALAAHLLIAGPAGAADLSEPLRPLAPIVSTPDKPVVDVSRFELALNGQAIRNLHSINDGEYGGETLIVWDQAKQKVVYYYFTTAGFYTSGTMSFEDGAIVSRELVTGSANGVTEVAATSRLLPDGRLSVKTRMLKNAQWVEGRERIYAEDPKAVVRFKD